MQFLLLLGGFKENVLDESENFKVISFNTKSITELFKEGDIYIAGSDNKTFDFLSAIENTELNTTSIVSATDSTTIDTLIVGNSVESVETYVDDGFLYKIDQNKNTDRFKGCLSEIRIG